MLVYLTGNATAKKKKNETKMNSQHLQLRVEHFKNASFGNEM